jgi:uncharacterized protein YukE
VPEMHSIGHYNYENVDLKQKAAWLATAPGGEGDPLPAKLQHVANTCQQSHARLTANIEALGAAWTGQGADAAQTSLRTANDRTTAARQANDDGHAAVTDYGVSFEEMRRKVHFEDPNVGWQPTPAAGAPVPGDPFVVQNDQFGPVQQNRTADAAANAALRAHEQRTRDLVNQFPTLTAGVGAPPGGAPPAATPQAQGPSSGPGGAPVMSPGGAPSAATPASSTPMSPVPVGPAPAPGVGGPSPAGPVPGVATPADVGNSARSAAVPPQQAPAANPSRLGPAPNATGPGIQAGMPPLSTSLSPNGRRSAPPVAVPPIPGVTDNGVIGGRTPESNPGSDGRKFASKLPMVAEPAPVSARPGQPTPTAAAANGRPGGSAMPPPMMGGMGGGGGSSTRRTKYWTPTPEAFDVDLPPHVDGVIGAEPEDAR